MASELRRTILEADDETFEFVTVREWTFKETGEPVVVEVRSLQAGERTKLVTAAMAVAKAKGSEDIDPVAFNQRLLVASCYEPREVVLNDEGEVEKYGPPNKDKLFTASDAEALMTKNAAAIERLVGAASRLSGMGAAQIEEAKANFPNTPSDDSSLN